MTQKSRSLFILFILLGHIIHCKSWAQIQNEATGDEQRLLYQIGDEWNRKTLSDPRHFPLQIFQLYRTGMGPVGTGVYLGKFADQHIVMTAGHVYKDLESCEDEVNFLVLYQDIRFYVTCDGWHYKFAENDVMIFSITTKNKLDLDLLRPVEFSIKHASGQPLNMISINRGDTFHFTWSIDDQEDCRLLSDREKRIYDPDTMHPLLSLVWSLPVGCDGQPGDSGAPIYDSAFRLKGIVWTGRYPKSHRSSAQLVLDIQNQSELIWREYNYIAPISSFLREIDTLRENSLTLSQNTSKIFSAISEKIKSMKNKR